MAQGLQLGTDLTGIDLPALLAKVSALLPGADAEVATNGGRPITAEPAA